MCIRDRLYEALFVPPGKPKFPRSILEDPGIKKYISHWNQQKGDIAIVAITSGELVGAIWGKIFKEDKKGYGYVDDATPEISMAIKEGYRNRGLGTELLKQIEIEYKGKGIEQLSLSVDKVNPAKGLYERTGYSIYKEEGTAFIMVKKLTI